MLEVTRTAKYLGVIIDDKLTWQPHADHLSRKCGQATGQLWRSGRSFSLRARRTWYLSMLQSCLLYASNAFSPSLNRSLISGIEKLSKADIHAVLRVHHRTECSPLRCQLNVKSITHLHHEKQIVVVLRCLHNISSVLFNDFFDVFQSNNEGRGSRGQLSFLLQIPSLPGPSGRKTMHFICATRWNKLPHNIRSICNLSQFKCSISEVDLLSLDR